MINYQRSKAKLLTPAPEKKRKKNTKGEVEKMERQYKNFWLSLLYDVPYTVTRNKNHKTITVTVKSKPPLKIIAAYQTWLDLQDKFSRSEDNFSFQDIEPYINSATSKNLLKKLCEDDRHTFLNLIYHYAIEPSLSLSPLYEPANKKRGGNPYGLNWLEMHNLRQLARWSYCYLREYKEYNYDDALGKTIDLVKDYARKKYNIDFSECSLKSFYNHFIAYQDLRYIKETVKKNKVLAERKIAEIAEFKKYIP